MKKQEDVFNEDVFCPFIDATCRKKCLFFDQEIEEGSFCILKFSLHGFHYFLSILDGSDPEIIEEENLEEKTQFKIFG